jgi:hypothetical protein
MSDTVTIPADVARSLADELRIHARQCPPAGSMAASLRAAADMLDPKPPTLREQVASMVGAAINTAYPTMTHDAPEHDDHWAGVIIGSLRDATAALPRAADACHPASGIRVEAVVLHDLLDLLDGVES